MKNRCISRTDPNVNAQRCYGFSVERLRTWHMPHADCVTRSALSRLAVARRAAPLLPLSLFSGLSERGPRPPAAGTDEPRASFVNTSRA